MFLKSSLFHYQYDNGSLGFPNSTCPGLTLAPCLMLAGSKQDVLGQYWPPTDSVSARTCPPGLLLMLHGLWLRPETSKDLSSRTLQLPAFPIHHRLPMWFLGHSHAYMSENLLSSWVQMRGQQELPFVLAVWAQRRTDLDSIPLSLFLTPTSSPSLIGYLVGQRYFKVPINLAASSLHTM